VGEIHAKRLFVSSSILTILYSELPRGARVKELIVE
jgi:hypothetical protein